jgi:hypothetical protein
MATWASHNGANFPTGRLGQKASKREKGGPTPPTEAATTKRQRPAGEAEGEPGAMADPAPTASEEVAGLDRVLTRLALTDDDKLEPVGFVISRRHV